MRRRRAQRCLLRAEAALNAGCIDDARAAVDEARALHAPPEEIARVDALIGASVAAAETPQRRMRWKPFIVAAAIVIVVSAFGLGTLQPETPAPVPTAQADASAADAPSDTPPTTVQNVPVRISEVVAVPTTGIAPDDAATSSPPEAEMDAAAAAPAGGPEHAVVERGDPASFSRVAAPPPLVSTSTPALASTGTPIPPPAPPPPPPDAPARETIRPAARVAPNVGPVPGLAAAPPPRDESAEVRAVLSHYENAYSELNPSLARAVWPAVDERALARAFSSLASQQLSLGRCDVSLNGATARATCTGTQTWAPKVGGGGPRTEARRWTFDLRRAGDTWRIERVVAR